MYGIVREVLCYCFFLWIIYVIAYSNRNEQAFLQVQHLRSFILNSNNHTHDYAKVSFISAISLTIWKELRMIKIDASIRSLKFVTIGLG